MLIFLYLIVFHCIYIILNIEIKEEFLLTGEDRVCPQTGSRSR